jgi:KaiC/GvpD/RAD55 family RecA-like ATPase
MIVQLLSLDPIWTLFAVFGILTLFGKKKKDEKENEETQEASASSTSSPPNAPTMSYPQQAPPTPANSPATPNPTPVSTTSYQAPRSWSSPAQTDEDSSLSRLLQSLLRDLPPDSSSMGSDQMGTFSMQSTPEWVPPRATPASRPMVIVPGGKKGPDLDQSAQASSSSTTAAPSSPMVSVPPTPAPPTRVLKPPEPAAQPSKGTSQPKFYPPPSTDKPEKPVQDAAPKRPSPPKISQGFDHIFEITQGSLDSPGLVIVNGSQGAGKTTLCSGLASSFLKQGSPCMFVTYDKAPAALRDQMKKIGADPSEAESQYRFLLVDGFSSQSDSFSFEPYYVEKAFDFDSIQDALVKNSSMFIGEKTKILFDSIDQIVAKVPSKDVVKRLGETLDKLRDSNVTLIVTADLSKAPKDVVKWLEDTASCVIDLDKDDSDPNGRELKVRKLNGSSSKLDAETFEIDSGKGLVFVK